MTVTVRVIAEGVDTTATGTSAQGTVRRLLGRNVSLFGGEHVGEARRYKILREGKHDGVAIVTDC